MPAFVRRPPSRYTLSWSAGISTTVGVAAAIPVALEKWGYVASLTFFIIILIGIPVVITLFIIALIALVYEDEESGLALLLACVLLPVSFFGAHILMQSTGVSRYVGNDKMIPLGSEFKERLVVLIKSDVPKSEVNDFEERVLRKRIENDIGILLDFTDGICGIAYPAHPSKRILIEVPFCNDAGPAIKSRIKERVASSEIVEQVFENIPAEKVRIR